jgi:hypothetical protein
MTSVTITPDTLQAFWILQRVYTYLLFTHGKERGTAETLRLICDAQLRTRKGIR